jgi:peroxiredoxin Q/BCP
MLEIGQAFPDFELRDQDSKPVALKSLLGSWAVVYFYPKDNTSGCSLEAGEFTRLAENFKALKAKVVGVSPDSVESHACFVAKKNLGVTLLSDPDKTLLKAAGAYRLKKAFGKEGYGVVRSTYLLDQKGVVREAWDKVKASGHAQAVLEKLKELKKAAK